LLLLTAWLKMSQGTCPSDSLQRNTKGPSSCFFLAFCRMMQYSNDNINGDIEEQKWNHIFEEATALRVFVTRSAFFYREVRS
ncbi:MAG: hypothetical protein IKE03_07975, partial [Blautia sp.]|nr:hypothetical protein [Blautia sp.]